MKDRQKTQAIIAEVCAKARVSNPRQLALKLGLNGRAVNHWIYKGCIPPKHILIIHKRFAVPLKTLKGE